MSVELATEHVWRTEDGRYVESGDPDARFLAAAPGDPLPVGYRRSAKQAPKPANKQAPKPGDKSAADD